MNLSMLKLGVLGGAVLAAAIAITGLLIEEETGPPNIIVIVADDLGWSDVGYHSDRVVTPNIDALAASGLELDRFYTAPSCSPTRAGLMTGRYPIRFGMARSALPPYRRFGLPPQERTLPEVLADYGYASRGAFGKWHLGHLEVQWHPLAQGFTHFEGHYNGAIDYFRHTFKGERDWHVNYEPTVRSGYATDLIADAAERFIRDNVAEVSPYFAWVAFNAPHAPFQAKPGDVLELGYSPADMSKAETLNAMVFGLDKALGRILKAVETTGEKDNTIIWFLSDNGGERAIRNGNAPLNGHKLNTFEGGIRVPSVVSWPGVWSGGRKVEDVIGYIDLLPTLADVASNGRWQSAELDGKSLLGVFSEEKEPLAKRDWYSYLGQDSEAREWLAIASDGWKLIVYGPRLTEKGLTTDHLVALYNIEIDPYEETDLTRQFPRRIELLARKLAAHRALQPANSIPPYMEGSKAPFIPPKDWRNGPTKR